MSSQQPFDLLVKELCLHSSSNPAFPVFSSVELTQTFHKNNLSAFCFISSFHFLVRLIEVWLRKKGMVASSPRARLWVTWHPPTTVALLSCHQLLHSKMPWHPWPSSSIYDHFFLLFLSFLHCFLLYFHTSFFICLYRLIFFGVDSWVYSYPVYSVCISWVLFLYSSFPNSQWSLDLSSNASPGTGLCNIAFITWATKELKKNIVGEKRTRRVSVYNKQ